MSLYQRIKKEQLDARKAKVKIHIDLLTTLLGEIQSSVTGSLSAAQFGVLNPTDAEVLKVVKKFIKNTKETLALTPSNELATLELEILESFMPKQLSDTELGVVVGQILSTADSSLTGGKLMGFVMSQLKAQYEGLFDASKVKGLLEAK